jgi:hypothetical protein
MSAQTQVLILQLHDDAIQAGTGQRFLAAFRAIVARLHRDPRVFGEPLYRLPALRLEIRKAAVLPLVVDYGVHEDRPLVFIRGIRVLS